MKGFRFFITLVFLHQVLAPCPDGGPWCDSDQCARAHYICPGDILACNPDGVSVFEADSCPFRDGEEWRPEYCGRGQFGCRNLGNSDCVSLVRYCDFRDPSCRSIDFELCELLRELQAVMPPEVKTALELTEELGEELILKMNHTLRHPSCPEFYTQIGDECISVFFLGKVNWGEAQSFCQTIGGDLLTLHDIKKFQTVTTHLLLQGLESDFWVGGSFQNKSQGWTWVDGHPMEMGSPFWTLRSSYDCHTRTVTPGHNVTREANEGHCYHTQQAPLTPPLGNCAALDFDNFFYMSDEPCLSRRGVLCVAKEEGRV